MSVDPLRKQFRLRLKPQCLVLMKINTNTQIKLVAHITLNGLESLERGQIDLKDPRLDGGLGTVQLELDADEHTAKAMEAETDLARAIHGAEAALHYLQNIFIEPGLAYISMATLRRSRNRFICPK